MKWTKSQLKKSVFNLKFLLITFSQWGHKDLGDYSFSDGWTNLTCFTRLALLLNTCEWKDNEIIQTLNSGNIFYDTISQLAQLKDRVARCTSLMCWAKFIFPLNPCNWKMNNTFMKRPFLSKKLAVYSL